MESWLVASSILLWIVVLCNLLLTLALVRRMNTGVSLKQGLKEGQRAPEFTAQALSGETVSLANYAGRSVAFLFVAPTCQPCREALPTYEEWGPKAARSDVELVLVSTADVEHTRRFVDEFAIHLPVLVAPRESNSFMQDYQLSSTPSYCLIDRQGKIQSTGLPHLRKWKEVVQAWGAQAVDGLSLATSERR